MTMMTIPATIASSADQAWIKPPISDALAPSATNTVEKPSTNMAADVITARLEDDTVSSLATCSMVAPGREIRYGGTKGSTQGDTKLIRPAISAAGIETSWIMQ